MSARKKKCVLILDGGDGVGEAAATQFNAVAGKLGLAFEAATETPGDDPPAAMIAVNGSPLDGAEHWTIPNGSEANAAIEREVSGLIARLLGGRTVADAPAPAKPVSEKPKKVHTVRVGRETAGRHGKGVTTVFDLPLTLDQIKELATTLKQKCGTGGTVKDARIEIQGEHRDKITAELEKLGYKVKRTGG
jgi:predicted translation initiation factor SUI1